MKKLILIILISAGCAKSNLSQPVVISSEGGCIKPATSTGLFVSDLPIDLQVFGDSLAAGFSSCDPSAPNDLATGYAVPLAKDLNMTLDDRAIGGTESGNQLLQIETYGQRYTPIKMLMSGYNDAYYQTDIDVYKYNIALSIQIMAANADLVIIGTTPQPYIGDVRSGGVNMYAQAIRDVVAALSLSNVKLVDVNILFPFDPSNFDPDHVHFNSKGSAQLDALFLTAIQGN